MASPLGRCPLGALEGFPWKKSLLWNHKIRRNRENFFWNVVLFKPRAAESRFNFLLNVAHWEGLKLSVRQHIRATAFSFLCSEHRRRVARIFLGYVVPEIFPACQLAAGYGRDAMPGSLSFLLKTNLLSICSAQPEQGGFSVLTRPMALPVWNGPQKRPEIVV